jgi:hypothetical protein
MRGDSRVLGFFYDTVPFLNAGVVSADRMIRGFYRGEENRAGNAVKIGLLTSAALGLYALNRSNPLYDQLEDWDKDSHWHFFVPRPGTDARMPPAERYLHFRYPKAWELGLVSTLAERTVGAMLGDEKFRDLGGKLMRAVAHVEHLDYVPAALAPLYEVASNRNLMTGSPIEGQAQSELQPWARATSGTSPTLKKLGEMERGLPTSMQVSPEVMQTLLHGYLNNWAETGLALTDWALRRAAHHSRRNGLTRCRWCAGFMSRSPRARHAT